MIGLVIVTHCGLALEFRAALEHVVGPQTQLETVSIGPEDDAAVRRGQIVDAIHRTDTGDGVIVLTDMFGGTPSNLAISVMDEANVEVIAGINLPILVKLASVRGEMPIADAVVRPRGGPQVHQGRQPGAVGRRFGVRLCQRSEDSTRPEAVVTIRNRKGLHARASAKFVKCAESYDAIITVTRDGHAVGGTSIMGLMMLAAGPGSTLHMTAQGPQGPEALQALIALVEDGFGEDCIEDA